MRNKVIFKPGARVVVWISQRDDVREGDAGTVISIRPNYQSTDTYYVDVILDTGIRMGNYHSGTFKLEEDWHRAKK